MQTKEQNKKKQPSTVHLLFEVFITNLEFLNCETFNQALRHCGFNKYTKNRRYLSTLYKHTLR
jgi:hypothetical protein